MDQNAKSTAGSTSAGVSFGVHKLKQAVGRAKQMGFQVRSEWLGGTAEGWCEVAGKRILFVDLSLSIDEQLAQVEAAIDASLGKDRNAA